MARSLVNWDKLDKLAAMKELERKINDEITYQFPHLFDKNLVRERRQRVWEKSEKERLKWVRYYAKLREEKRGRRRGSGRNPPAKPFKIKLF